MQLIIKEKVNQLKINLYMMKVIKLAYKDIKIAIMNRFHMFKKVE